MNDICSRNNKGFTLIELSIVLVIIGLIVGGILTGRDLIDAATQRAQITQLERYQTAVRAFQGKYGGLPGDLQDPQASQFGFQGRGQYAGEGDGNGILEGNCSNIAGGNNGFATGCGELAVFWADLTAANTIDSNLSSPTILYGGVKYTYTTPSIQNFIPASKLGQGNFIYAYSSSGINYLAVSQVTKLGGAIENITNVANPGLTVQQAYNIDKKVDDGLPQSGSVTACYANYDIVNYAAIWASSGWVQGASGGSNCVPTTAATVYNANNCYDNSYAGGSAAAQNYQLKNATSLNCALSFRFQ